MLSWGPEAWDFGAALWDLLPCPPIPTFSPAYQWASRRRWEGGIPYHLPIYTGLVLTMIILFESSEVPGLENRTLQPVLSGSHSLPIPASEKHP